MRKPRRRRRGPARTAIMAAASRRPRWRGKGLTDVQGIKVGHHHPDRAADRLHGDSRPGRDDRRRRRQRGGAPGTRETDLLNPVEHASTMVNAITLAGGSAYGLDAAQGVMRYLEEHNIGYKVGAGRRADRAGGDPVRPRVRRRLEDPADRRLRLQGRAGGDRRAGRRGQRRRGRRSDGRQDGTGPLDEGRARLGVDHAARRSRRRGAGRGQRGRRRRRSGHRAGRRRRADRGRQGAGRRPHCCCDRRAAAPRAAARRREHDDRRRRDQREADEGAGAEGRADGARRLRARDLAGPHAG